MCIKFYLTLDHLIVDLCSSLKTMHDKQYIQLIWHIHIFTSKTFYSQHYFAEHISPASLNPASNQLWHLYVLRGKNKMLCSVYYGFISFIINYQNPFQSCLSLALCHFLSHTSLSLFVMSWPDPSSSFSLSTRCIWLLTLISGPV